jgi:hypothetical protein
MHGLINRAIQCFVRDTYGAEAWSRVCRKAGLGFVEFEAMLRYEDAITERLIDAATRMLAKDRGTFLEDMGTYLVTYPDLDALRRLLRFGGETFVEFLHSLDDLHDRVKLALPDLEVPVFEVREHSPTSFSIALTWETPGLSQMIVGILRAMADDYGALVVLEHTAAGGRDVIGVSLLVKSYAEGRSFALGRAPR